MARKSKNKDSQKMGNSNKSKGKKQHKNAGECDVEASEHNAQSGVVSSTHTHPLSSLASPDRDQQHLPSLENLPPLPDSVPTTPSATPLSFAPHDPSCRDAESFDQPLQSHLDEGNQSGEKEDENTVDDEHGHMPDCENKTKSCDEDIVPVESETSMIPETGPVTLENQDRAKAASTEGDATLANVTGPSPAPNDIHSAQGDNREGYYHKHNYREMERSFSSPHNLSYHIPSGGPLRQGYSQYCPGAPCSTMSGQQSSQREQQEPLRLSENCTPVPSDGDPGDLFGRIQAAMPDMHRLLASYREKQSQLTTCEAGIRHMQAEHERTLMQKEFYTEALQEQMRKTVSESAEECSKLKGNIRELRDEVAELKDRHRDVEENLSKARKVNDNLADIRAELHDQVEELQQRAQDDEEVHARQREQQVEKERQALADQKEEMQKAFQEDKQTALESLSRDLDAMKVELKDRNAEIESKGAELHSANDELSAALTGLDSKQTELDSKQDELDATQAELDEMKQRHAGEFATLREALEEQTNAVKEARKHVSDLTTEYEQRDGSWKRAREELETQLAGKSADAEQAIEEKETLLRDGKERDERVKDIVEEMQHAHDRLAEGRERLKSSLGHPTAANAKGDIFFVERFEELSRLIVDASKDFVECSPVEARPDILAKIPFNIPQFLDDTQASRELRVAYIQHLISSTLDCRMFRPFLFTLGRRYDKAEAFLQSLWLDIRRKSIRGETLWRQQTLRAAYTASNAKQSINVAAAVIVDEIVDDIRPFTKPSRLESVVIAVRKIVKLAAETWRLARVERELITATTMSSSQDTAPTDEVRSEFQYDHAEESDTPTEGARGQAQPNRRALLHTLPRIVREARHEDLLSEDDKEKATACVYLPGVVLYTDSPSVIRRREELGKREQ